MRSRASFDLDSSNNPILKLEVASTSDVRDKIAKRFVGSLGHNSQWCVILQTGESEWQIWPLKPDELRLASEHIKDRADVVEGIDKLKAVEPAPISVE